MSNATDFKSQYEEAMNKFTNDKLRPGTVAPTVEYRPAKPVTSYFTEVADNTPDDWKRFSEVFGFAPPSGNDRLGPTYLATEFPDDLRGFIPAVDPDYILQPELVEALWNAHIDNDVVWLHGASGTGKSSLEEQFAAHIGQPFLRFNGREDTESSALFGQLTVESGEGGGTIWKDGLLTEGVKYGARVLMDEATVIPAGIWMGLQWCLEKGGKLMLTDKPATAGERLVDPDPRFRLTLADNTRGQGDDMGQFNGTGVMNTATLNRVGLTLEVKFLSFAQELDLLARKFGDRIHTEILGNVVQMADLLRQAQRAGEISLSFSPRSTSSMLTKAYNYRTLPVHQAMLRAFDESWANLLPSDDEYGAAQNIWGMCFNQYS